MTEAETPSCRICGEPAACIGQYDDEPEATASCDDCCPHTNEHGYCRLIDDERRADA